MCADFHLLLLIPKPHTGLHRVPWAAMNSPERDLDSEVPIHSNSKQSQDGALGEDEDRTGHHEAGVEVGLWPNVDKDGQWDDQGANSHISYRQGYDEAEGSIAKCLVHLHSPNHQYISGHRDQGNVPGPPGRKDRACNLPWHPPSRKTFLSSLPLSAHLRAFLMWPHCCNGRTLRPSPSNELRLA